MPTYCGINGVVRKLKEWPVGVGGVVKQQKEVWAAEGGVKRKIFSAADPVTVTLRTYYSNPAVLNSHFILKINSKAYDFGGGMGEPTVEIQASVGDTLFAAIPAGTSGKVIVDYDTAHPLLTYSENLQKNRTVTVFYDQYSYSYRVEVT